MKIKTPEEILAEMHLIVEEGRTVDAHTYLVAEAMRRYAAQFTLHPGFEAVYTLQTGSWDDVHLSGVFTTKENADNFVAKFGVKDNPTIERVLVNPSLNVVNSPDLHPFLATCKRKGKVRIRKDNIYDYFVDGSVHFNHGMMYYYVSAKDANEAREKAEQMRETVILKSQLSKDHPGEETF